MNEEEAFAIFLEQLRMLVPMEEEEFNILRGYFRFERIPKKSTPTRIGQQEKRIYFIADGVMRAWFERDGEDQTAAFVYRGFWGTSFESFLRGTPSPYEIEALTDCVILSLNADKKESALEHCPSFHLFYTRLMEEVIVGMQFRERELMASDAKERFQRFMGQSAFLLQHVPQKQLASYLNMTPETFSRLRRSWMEES
ncbi:MAG: Crp/Fnr family transcriptional regulator [Bacteroidota bacterium]|nr:Crp/Fnr family transcriptional regulator [Bacteroidota bacterium]MDX5431607.1 Crp/Fnr family transcriptional regulator [Bacteroidota bacterium]MDX5470328.1 Crp/Fnr family transcriptional regulator [Bacteroidota bacterium]